ncbi:hypothetical protein AB2N08_06300 [Massilia aurea]|uniref:hypothetical protein n=1 Tax=Massilia aurea TaxID=373040 RepID=UPI0034625CB2
MDSHESRGSAQLIDELGTALAWMQSLGVEVEAGRLAAYRKMAEKWDAAVGGRGKLGVRELAPMIATFAYDVMAFIEIHRAFRAVAQNALGGLIAQLSLAAGGPVRIDDARCTGPRPARDALFRARTAAYLQQATGAASFGSAGNTGFAMGRHYLHVVPHRLQPSNDIATGVTATCVRLLSALDGRPGPRSRGLVALDASALITPAGQAPPTLARSAMVGAADHRLARFIDEQMDVVQNSLRGLDRRIIGLMLMSSSVAVADDDSAFVPVDRWVLVWRENINITDFDLLDRLRGLLRGER